jgi:uncharacterized damage-inducible protein DinB
MAIELARYNRWQNEELLERCAALGESDLTRDVGLFFGSILATLDHILMTDHVFLKYLEEMKPPEAFNPTARRHESLQSLRLERQAMDNKILDWMTGFSDSWFDAEISFQSERLGRVRAFPRAFMVSQMFNHQTHHRSQATAALHQMGVDYGSTDLPFSPQSQY